MRETARFKSRLRRKEKHKSGGNQARIVLYYAQRKMAKIPTTSTTLLRDIAHAGGAALPFIMTATMYDPSWNVARVTARGFGNAEAVLKFGATKEPLVIRIR